MPNATGLIAHCTELLSVRIRQWVPAEDAKLEVPPDSLPAAVEALDETILPGTPRIDEVRSDPR